MLTNVGGGNPLTILLEARVGFMLPLLVGSIGAVGRPGHDPKSQSITGPVNGLIVDDHDMAIRVSWIELMPSLPASRSFFKGEHGVLRIEAKRHGVHKSS